MIFIAAIWRSFVRYLEFHFFQLQQRNKWHRNKKCL